MTRYALIDCNNFFASCERIFRPELQTHPVIVMSNNDGCVIARTNEVRALGIPMGVPIFKVRDIIKDHRITLFSANFELYGDISQRIVSILREMTPLIEVYSIDESFMDLSELIIDDVEAWANSLKERIWREVGVPVSVGIAPTKTLAKVASTYAKTHKAGVEVCETDAERRNMLRELPVEELWGIGRRLAPKLKDKGVSRALTLIESPNAWLRQQLNVTGMKMIDELRGEARIPFGDASDQRKSIMRSRSFGHTVRAYHQIESAIATFTAQAAARLRAQDSVCRGIVVYLDSGKNMHEQRVYASHLVTLPEATADTGTLIAAALSGLGVVYDVEGVYRKAGVIVVNIQSTDAWQLALIEGDAKRDEKVNLMNAMDALNKKYGKNTVWHASEARQQADWRSRRKQMSPRYTTQLSELPLLK